MDDFRQTIFTDEDTAFSPVLVKSAARETEPGSLCTIKINRQAARVSNQRTEVRHPAAEERATVHFRSKTFGASVVNISSSGAMIESEIEPYIGEPLEVGFGELPPRPCVARWVRGGRVGVEFGLRNIMVDHGPAQEFVYGLGQAEPLPPSGPEDEEADSPTSEREPRQAVIRTAQVRAGTKVIPVRLCNISPGGVMLESEQCLTPGSEVRLEMAGGVTVTAEVRWNNGKRAGLSFDDTIDLKGLGSLPITRSKIMRPSYLDTEFDPDSPWAARFDRLTMKDLNAG